MGALNDAQTAAMLAFLKTRRGDKELKPDELVEAMLKYLKAKGIPVNELETLAPGASEEDKEDFIQQWREYAVAAGVDDVPSVNLVGRWISRPEGHSQRSARSGKLAVIADVLARHGHVIDRETEAHVMSALVNVDKGATEEQSSCVEVIWIIYTGQSPGVEERTWFEEKRAASVMMTDGKQPKVDVRRCKGYYKELAANSAMTLERALFKDKTGTSWALYYQNTVGMLQNLGYGAAASRFMKVCSFAKKVSKGIIEHELEYLSSFFFDEFLGCGMPQEQCHTCALTMGTIAVKKLTVPLENDAYQQQMLAMGHWAGGTSSSMQMAYGRPQHMGMPAHDAAMAARLQHAEIQLQQWNLWSQQQQQQQPGGAMQQAMQPPAQVSNPPPPGNDSVDCAFCGSKSHMIDKCTEMHKARGSFRTSKKAEKKLLEDAQKAAKAAADAAAAAQGQPP